MAKKNKKRTSRIKQTEGINSSLATQLAKVQITPPHQPKAPNEPKKIQTSPKLEDIESEDTLSRRDMAIILGLDLAQPERIKAEQPEDEDWNRALDGIEPLRPSHKKKTPIQKLHTSQVRPVTRSYAHPRSEAAEHATEVNDLQEATDQTFLQKSPNPSIEENPRCPNCMQQPVISDATKSEASPEICDEHNQLARKPQSDNVREMHSELHTLHAEVYNLQLNNQQLVAQLAKREQELVQEREQNQHLIEQINHAKNNYQPIPVVESKLSLPKLLSEQGIEPSLQAEAIRALIHPKNMDILSMLYADPMQIKPKLTKAFALSCDHPECIAALQQVANALVMVEHPYQCEYCAGSDNQRAIRLMVQICNKHRCYRLAIVGGSDQAHQEIRSLLKDNFKLSLINGELRRNKQQATEDLRNNDLIVIWCTAQLPHRTSELYTEQRDAFPNRIIRVHRNGISSLASEICQFLEQSHNMGQSNRS